MQHVNVSGVTLNLATFFHTEASARAVLLCCSIDNTLCRVVEALLSFLYNAGTYVVLFMQELRLRKVAGDWSFHAQHISRNYSSVNGIISP